MLTRSVRIEVFCISSKGHTHKRERVGGFSNTSGDTKRGEHFHLSMSVKALDVVAVLVLTTRSPRGENDAAVV